MTTAIVQSLSAALLHFVWQGLVVAFLLWVTLFVLRKRSANSRYVASCLALAVLAVLPAITASVLYTSPAAARAGVERVAAVSTVAVANIGTALAPRDWLAAWQSWAVPAWSLGVLLFSIRLVWGCKQVSSLRRRGTPAEEPVLAIIASLANRLALSRKVRVLITAAADGPSVVGWLRPVILLPSATLLGLTPEQLESVLAHELAHIRRHDYMVNVLQILAETLLFYHPAVWWISSRIRQERELCCDDLAVRSCGDALCYARALTKLERLRVMAPEMAMASTGGPLLYRIQRLIGSNTQEYGPSKLPGIVALCLGLACLVVNVHRAHGQEQEGKPGNLGIAFDSIVEQTRDGAGVHIDLGAAAILHRTSVEYPRAAIEKSIQGTVTVEATLDATGNVADARVLSGPVELRRSALRSVFEWHFLPDTAGSVRQVSIDFQLAEAKSREAAGVEKGEVRVFSYARNGETYTVRAVAPTLELKADAIELTQDRHPDEGKLLDERRRELEAAQKSLEGLQNQAERSELEAHMKGLRERIQELESGRNALGDREEPPIRMIGRKLARIDAVGFSDPVRQAIVSRIPVHLGDTLSEQSLESIAATLRKFDEHLELRTFQLETGEIGIRIIAPEQ